MRSVFVFLDTATGNMEAYASMELFSELHPDLDLSTRNDQGDVIVQTRDRPWGRVLGYVQECYLRETASR